MRSMLYALAVASLAGCSGPSDEEVSMAAWNCQRLAVKQMTSNGLGSGETRVHDQWTKRGAIVLDVGFIEKSTGKSYTTRCVVDFAKQEVWLPSLIAQGEWAK